MRARPRELWKVCGDRGGVRLMRLMLRALWAGAWLVGLLAGMPWLLAVVTAQLLNGAVDWVGLVAQPLSVAGVVVVLIAAGWLSWVWLVVGTILDMVAWIRGRGRVRLPVPLHTAVGTVTGAAMLLVDAVAGRGDAVHVVPATGPALAVAAHAGTAVLPSDTPQTPNDTTAAPDQPGSRRSGVQFAGGWLPLPAAVLASAAVTMMWAQRRRLYQPRRPAGAARIDVDLAPTPAVLAGLWRGVQLGIENDTAGLGQEVDWDIPTTAPGPVIGVIDGRWMRPDELPAGGLGVTGPGASGALRGLLTTLLTSALRTAVDSWQLVITVGDAKALFGAAVPRSPCLYLATDDDAALQHLAQYPAAADATSAAGARAGVLLIRLQPPSGHQAARLQAVLTATAGRAVAVLGGAWPSGQTWYVADDGTAHAVSPAGLSPSARLAVLNVSAAAALVAIIHDAAPPRAAPAAITRSNGVTQRRTGGRERSGLPDSASAPRRLRLRVLGPVTLLRPHPDGSASTVHVSRTASQQLLVYLAVHRDGAATDELKEALWPDVPNSAATRRLATNLSELRRVLEHAAGGPVLLRAINPPDGGGTRYWLDPDLIQADLWQLHNLRNAAEAAAGDTARAALLRDAADLDRGALAQGLTGEWLDVDRETTARRLVDLYVHLADLETDHQAALRWLRRATELAPHSETLYRAAMRRHAAANDEEGVRLVLATAVECLAELGAAPDDETCDLAADLCAELEAGTSDMGRPDAGSAASGQVQ